MDYSAEDYQSVKQLAEPCSLWHSSHWLFAIRQEGLNMDGDGTIGNSEVVRTRDTVGMAMKKLEGILTPHPSGSDRFVLWHIPGHGRYLVLHEFPEGITEYLEYWVDRVNPIEEAGILKAIRDVPLSPRASEEVQIAYALYIEPILATP